MKRHLPCSPADTSARERKADKEGGMDELLEVLGYKVRSSDMAEVAEKLEKLEMAMETYQEDSIHHLSNDAVHYNPSDLSSWLHSMLGELHSPPFDNSSSQEPESSDAYDLSAIPGDALCNTNESSSSSKRIKASSDTATKPVVLVDDSQETGVRLVHTLLACAEAVDQGDLKLADTLVKQVGLLAAAQAGAMRKVAIYFAEALARRIYGIYPRDSFDSFYIEMLHMQFYEASPYLKFAHFTANQAILEAISAARKVHVIDLGVNQGLQWPALMQALALRPEGPPSFRLTVIAEVEDDESLQQIGCRLTDLSRSIGIEFEFNRLDMRSLIDLDPSYLRSNEEVAINAMFELHRLLAASGSVEKVLSAFRSAKPRIVTVVEQEASHNSPAFINRFNESLHYYSSLFDSLEESGPDRTCSTEVIMAEMYLGRQICNVVACEGLGRVERHEPLSRWRDRFGSAGFRSVHIGSNAFKQASMLALFSGGEGYRVEENDGCLLLGWQTRPLIATSAWRPDSS